MKGFISSIGVTMIILVIVVILTIAMVLLTAWISLPFTSKMLILTFWLRPE